MDNFIALFFAFLIVAVFAALFRHALKVYANQSHPAQKRTVAIVAFLVGVVLVILVVVFMQARSRYGP